MYRMFLVVSAALAILSCKSYSKYPIDAQHNVELDTNILGTWKAVEDTDKMDYILVQSNYEVYPDARDKGSPMYTKYENCYILTRTSNSGQNLNFEKWPAYFSQIGNERFLNMTYRYTPFSKNTGADPDHREEGYFFVRIIHLNSKCDTMVTSVVADTTLKFLENSIQVRERISRNLYSPSFYRDTLHFYRVSKNHSSPKRSNWPCK
jgi:hypothetical protein